MTVNVKVKGDNETVRVQGKAEIDSRTQRLVARDGDKVTGEFPLDQIDHWFNEA